MTSISLVFTGHMVDLPGRTKARFPSSLEPAVRAAIAEQVHSRIKSASEIRGYASLARGGDILFHEICRAEGLRTVIVLPFAPEEFIETSVRGVPSGNWEKRFKRLWGETPPEDRHILGLRHTDNAYGLCNSKVLDLAKAAGRVHLIALWNGEGGDGPGGTADLVRKAKAVSDTPTILDPRKL